MFDKGMIGAMATGAFSGVCIGGFWLTGFYMGLKTRMEDYEREIKKLKKDLKKQSKNFVEKQ
jgi:hypothetical protein